MADCTREAVESWARPAGARWIRLLSSDPKHDPSIAAARFLADRTRWIFILTLSLSGRLATASLQDRRGCVLACDQSALDRPLIAGADDLAALCQSVLASAAAARTDFSTDRTGLIAIGDDADRWSPIVSRNLMLPDPLVPPQPASWPAIGMLLAPIRLDFATLRDRNESVNLAELRRDFASLMDTACDGITREGFDLDDADCGRFVRVEFSGCEGQTAGTSFEVDFDDFLYGHCPQLTSRQSAWRITGLRVSAAIYPPSPDWPLDVAPPLVHRL